MIIKCRPFFAGLLPEGNLRRLIAQQCQVSGQNDFALLNAIGGECVGAITFTPNAMSKFMPLSSGTLGFAETRLTK